MTSLLEFPPELKEEIFRYCYVSDLKNLACCSSLYNKAVKPTLWHSVVVERQALVKQDWTHPDDRKKLKNFKYTRTLQFVAAGLYSDLDSDNYCDREEEDMEKKLHANLKRILNYCNREVLDTFSIDFFTSPGINGPHMDGECIDLACKSLIRLKKLTVKSFLLPIYVHESIGKLEGLSVLNLDSSGTYNTGLCILFNDLPNLKVLNLSNTSVTDEALTHITNLTMLEELSVCECAITDAGLTFIGKLVTLNKLDVSSCCNITDEGIICLNNLASLKELYMHHCDVTDTSVPTIGVFKALQCLGLVGNMITDKGLSKLSGTNKSLLEFNIERTNVTDASLSCLSTLTSLKKLNVSNTGLEDTGLYEISTLTHLQLLNIGLTNVTDAGFKHLATLRSLRVLICNDTNITDIGVLDLCSMEKLQELLMCYCVHITDLALSHLSNMRSLEFIDLSHTYVSDVGLKHLSTMGSLKTLKCKGNDDVTEVGLGYLSNEIELIC